MNAGHPASLVQEPAVRDKGARVVGSVEVEPLAPRGRLAGSLAGRGRGGFAAADEGAKAVSCEWKVDGVSHRPIH